MHMIVGTVTPFVPALQMSNGRSAGLGRGKARATRASQANTEHNIHYANYGMAAVLM